MALSKITITFDDSYKVGDINTFSIQGPLGKNKGPMVERFQAIPRVVKNTIDLTTSNAAFLIGDDIGGIPSDDGLIAAGLYAHYFGYDHNSGDPFLVERVGKIVTITTRLDNFIFVNVSFPSASVVIDNDAAAVVAVDTIQVVANDIVAVSADFDTKFALNITTDEFFGDITINGFPSGLVIPPSTNSHDLDYLRDVDYSWRFYKAGSSTEYARYPATGKINIPILLAENFTVATGSNVGGGTMRATPNFISIVTHEYTVEGNGLLGNVWNTTPYYLGLADGTYNLKIRDKYGDNLLGSEISIPFTVSAIKIKTPFAYVSKANSLSFVEEEVTDDYSSFDNSDNAFSWELGQTKKYCTPALLRTNDKQKIQIKTSYENVVVTLRKEGGVDFLPVVNKLTNNINQFRAMDCIALAHGDTQTAVYFDSGQLYDVALTVIGQYTLNGNLPEFASVGNYAELDAYSAAEIVDIVYLDYIDKNCIILDMIFTEPNPIRIVIKSTYNILRYDAYDFEIDFNVHGEGLYDVTVELTDAEPEFDDVCFVSENIYVNEEQPNTVAIQYFSSTNRDIFYKYDMIHFVRFELTSADLIIKDQIENNVTDRSVNVIKSTLNKGFNFKFEPVTHEQAVRLGIALSSEYVFINGEGFVKNAELEVEQVENTNLVTMSAEMLKTGTNYSNIGEDIETVDAGQEEIFLPNLLDNKSNYIKF